MKVLFEDFVLKGEELLFFSRMFNGLMKMNIHSGIVDIVSKIPRYKYDTERLVTKIIEYKGKLFCIPMNADEIWIYRVSDDSWNCIDIGCGSEEKIYGKFFQAYLYKNRIYMIPSSYKSILVLDVDTNKISPIDFADERTKEIREKVGDCYFRTDGIMKDQYIYLASCIDNRVLIIDADTDFYSWKEVGKSTYRYSGISYDGKEFWLAPRKEGNILIWDGEKRYRELEIPQLPNAYYLGIRYYNRRFYMSGQSACGNIIINETSGQIKTDDIWYLADKVSDDGRLRVSIGHNAKVRINFCDKPSIEYMCNIDEDKLVGYLEIDGISYETDLFTINIFVNKLIEEMRA